MIEANILHEGFLPERAVLAQRLLNIKSLEESQREKREAPDAVILLGGGGSTGKKYGPLFARAGLPVSVILDINSEESSVSRASLPQAEYHQISPDFSEEDLGLVFDRFPKAALVVMTPQETHADILLKLAPLIATRGTPVWIDKPLAMSAQEAVSVSDVLERYPGLAQQVLSGGYTLDKATPELALLGAFGQNYPLVDKVKPADENSPDFASTYLVDNAREELGKLRNVRFLFVEGREDIREVVGKYGRTHLALYPGGGMTGDLLEHLTEKLIREGVLDLDAEFLSVYLGYTPMGLSRTSFPWQVPQDKGLAETEGEIILFGKDHAPVLLSYGKRGAQFLGDVRRSKLTFEHATLETQYITTKSGKSNIFVVSNEGGPTHRYFIDEDPYVLMLNRFKALWSGDLQGSGGLYSQLVNAFLIEDIYRIWQKRDPVLFRQSPKAGKFKEHVHRASEEYQRRQDADLELIRKMG